MPSRRASVPSAEAPVGDLAQLAAQSAGRQCGLRAIDAAGREVARSLEAVQGRVRDFVLGGVLAGRLAELVPRSLDVQHVVHDLEREPELAGVRVDRINRAVV